MNRMIVAVDGDCGIGKDGGIPWKYKEDFKFFAKSTKGSTCIMGRTTYEDIFATIGNRSELLPNRQSIVLTSKPDSDIVGAKAAKSLPEALELAERDDVYFIGGQSLYRECLPYIDEALITFIPKSYQCDVSISDVVEDIMAASVSSEVIRSGETGLRYAKYLLNPHNREIT